MHGFYSKTVLDFDDAARPDWGLTETAPYVGIADAGLGNGSGPIDWGSVHPVLLYRLYQYYGDPRLVERQYPVAKKWVDYLRGKARDHIIDITLGDHESIDPKDIAVSGTSFYYYNIHLLSRLAKILGRQADQEQYDRLAEEVKQAFIARFLDPVSGKVGLGTASTQAHALYFGLVPEKSLPAVLGRLVSEVSETHKGHVSTGIFGTKYVPEVLSRYGYSELAYGLITRPGFPGWVHMLEKGATTLWEHWEYSDNTYSHNHPMFGVVSEWLFRHLAGIRPAEDAAGFDRILIRPAVDLVPRLEAGYRSIQGLVSSGWSR
jgi:alpha-L-rhamnosidase